MKALAPSEIRAWRARHGLSMDALGAIIGVDRQTIYTWETERNRFPFYLAFALAYLDEHQEELS